MPKESLTKENLSRLPPEERIRKLKELEKKRMKEIAEAQEKIKESEEEIRERLKWLEKVPMPEFAKEDLEGLSEEARQVIRERKDLKEKRGEGSEEGAESRRKEELSLEEALAREKAELPPEARAVEYGIHLASLRPMQEIYRELAGIREAAEEGGRVTREQAGRAEYLGRAIEEKFAAAEGGNYPGFTREVAEKGLFSQEVASKVRALYRQGPGEQYQR